MKEWECVKLSHHDDVGRTIEELQKEGWRLNTYQAQGSPTIVNHYLLFEREKDKNLPPYIKSVAAAAAAAAT